MKKILEQTSKYFYFVPIYKNCVFLVQIGFVGSFGSVEF